MKGGSLDEVEAEFRPSGPPMCAVSCEGEFAGPRLVCMKPGARRFEADSNIQLANNPARQPHFKRHGQGLQTDKREEELGLLTGPLLPTTGEHTRAQLHDDTPWPSLVGSIDKLRAWEP
jgi:hypothetical protein